MHILLALFSHGMEEEAGQLLQMKSRSYRTSSKEGCRTALDIAQAACTVRIQSRYLGKPSLSGISMRKKDQVHLQLLPCHLKKSEICSVTVYL